MLSGCSVSSLAARFAFFPPDPATYALRKDEATGRLVASGVPRDNALDVLLLDTTRGTKVVAFYLRNPCARLTLLYSHGNAADLGQLYDLFVQLKVNLKVNLMGLVLHCAVPVLLLSLLFSRRTPHSTTFFCFSSRNYYFVRI